MLFQFLYNIVNLKHQVPLNTLHCWQQADSSAEQAWVKWQWTKESTTTPSYCVSDGAHGLPANCHQDVTQELIDADMIYETVISDNFGNQLFHLYHWFIPAASTIFISVWKQRQ